MALRWVQVRTETARCQDEHHWTDKELHTVRVEDGCDNLKEEVVKELSRLDIRAHKIKDIKFV